VAPGAVRCEVATKRGPGPVSLADPAERQPRGCGSNGGMTIRASVLLCREWLDVVFCDWFGLAVETVVVA
jgi:hypothetical protein